MTPAEQKARELVESYENLLNYIEVHESYNIRPFAKQCALICLEEMLDSCADSKFLLSVKEAVKAL